MCIKYFNNLKMANRQRINAEYIFIHLSKLCVVIIDAIIQFEKRKIGEILEE